MIDTLRYPEGDGRGQSLLRYGQLKPLLRHTVIGFWCKNDRATLLNDFWMFDTSRVCETCGKSLDWRNMEKLYYCTPLGANKDD